MTSTIPNQKVENFSWSWQKQEFTIAYETLGQGSPILLLPAFSTVSSRTEMAGIAQLLATEYQVWLLDWLGFGSSDRPKINYQPSLYQQLLTDFVLTHFQQPIAIAAAGHSAGYALKLAQDYPSSVSSIVLIAPTWRGPLKVMGVSTGIRKLVNNLVRSPIIGQLLYYLNTTPGFLRFMYRRHVYTDQTKLTPEFITKKRQITQQTGARFAPVAFVTGEIDPIDNQSDIIKSLSQPILNIIPEQSPPYSKTAMEAIAPLAKVDTVRLPGTLGIHEEYSVAVTEAIRPFLAKIN
ncbi:alpha/beta fold hydrolase [Gloeocapsa sp. PCC 73106]|uniref:alpha/beta fold hydrolase n=1 Tax=Gloeocapsa sp. PCC 73106 TaxID=102232 RepID=UPI0002AC6A7D|nr:alpha/beta fold hydrolase [Gloeocapsa sp. PCC 73106]ELR99715.1 putative hydrolase or acyltransferase of alpha/beta superfamily [Gloeocapsa sp. PCC 73106]